MLDDFETGAAVEEDVGKSSHEPIPNALGFGEWFFAYAKLWEDVSANSISGAKSIWNCSL